MCPKETTITTAHPWEVSYGALVLQYKVIKSPGINTVDSKCLTPVDMAHYAFMSCSMLRLINYSPNHIDLKSILVSNLLILLVNQKILSYYCGV